VFLFLIFTFIFTTMRRMIGPLLPPLPLHHMLSPEAATPAPPLLPLLKHWQQWRQHGIAAWGGTW